MMKLLFKKKKKKGFLFLPLHEACGILVPRPEIKTDPLIVSVLSPNHSRPPENSLGPPENSQMFLLFQ